MAFHCLPRPLLAWPRDLHAWHSPSPSSSSKDWHSTPTDLFPPSPSPFSQVVKVEPQDDPADGCFIIENPTADLHLVDSKVASFVSSQALAPPTEVPLRATQAPKKMKGMMGVFRINPFAMHNGSEGKGSAPTVGWEPGPLEEEPVMLEFQLDLIGYGDSDDDDDDGDVDDAGEGDPANLAITYGAIEPVFPKGRQVDPDVRLSTAALHAFSPDFDLHDDFVHAHTTSHSGSERYTSSPSGGGISQDSLPEDQAQSVASCTDNINASALLPPGNQRGESPFAFEYHNHHHHLHHHQQRPRSAASPCTFPPMRNDGTWNHDVGTVDITLSSEDRPLHVQNTSGEVDGEQHYHQVVHPHSQHPSSTAAITASTVASHAVRYDESVGVIETQNNCSYPSLVTQTVHQPNEYVVAAVQDVHEDPSQLGYPAPQIDATQTHTVTAFDGLGMYSIPSNVNGGDVGGRIQVTENSPPCMSGVPSANPTHISTSPTNSVVGVSQNMPVHGCSGMRYAPSRNSSHHHHRLYDAHHHQYQHYPPSHPHPYLRPLNNSSHINKLVERYHTSSRDCATYSDYSEEYEYDYDENKTGISNAYEQEYNPSHLMNHHHPHPSPQLHTMHHQTVITGAAHANINSPTLVSSAVALTTGLEGGGGRLWSSASSTHTPRQPSFTQSMLSGVTSRAA